MRKTLHGYSEVLLKFSTLKQNLHHGTQHLGTHRHSIWPRTDTAFWHEWTQHLGTNGHNILTRMDTAFWHE